MRAIDRLLKVAGTDRKIFKEVTIKGEDFSFYMKPLTIAEQQSAQKLAKNDDANEFALQLLVNKALTKMARSLCRLTRCRCFAMELRKQKWTSCFWR